jgi:hypothetical protein
VFTSPLSIFAIAKDWIVILFPAGPVVNRSSLTVMTIRASAELVRVTDVLVSFAVDAVPGWLLSAVNEVRFNPRAVKDALRSALCRINEFAFVLNVWVALSDPPLYTSNFTENPA